MIRAVFHVRSAPHTTRDTLLSYCGLASAADNKASMEHIEVGVPLQPLKLFLSKSNVSTTPAFLDASGVAAGETTMVLGKAVVHSTDKTTGKPRDYFHISQPVKLPELNSTARFATPEEITAVQRFVKTNRAPVCGPAEHAPPLRRRRGDLDHWKTMCTLNTDPTLAPTYSFISDATTAIADAKAAGVSKADVTNIVMRHVLCNGGIVIRAPTISDIANYQKAKREFEAASTATDSGGGGGGGGGRGRRRDKGSGERRVRAGAQLLGSGVPVQAGEDCPKAQDRLAPGQVEQAGPSRGHAPASSIWP